MASVARHLLSIAALPFTIAVLVPVWIAGRNGIRPQWPATGLDFALAIAGFLSLSLGLSLFVASLRRFESDGDGTLAPWDPPRRLVVRGPYRYVRNPMISGVMFVLLGEACLLRSGRHLVWTLIFVLMNVTWIPWYEEPHLEGLFGDQYREYKAHVRRFLPRLRPWEPGSPNSQLPTPNSPPPTPKS
jgi:protein-S-isoprenylcysteine O-methyltransferase Ste14